VDVLFRSIAEQRGAAGVAVVLSGMGSDGTLGLRAIKESGGVTFVQEPSTAAFDGMPRSAVDADVADVVAPVDELAGLVLEHISRPATAAAERLAEALKHEASFDYPSAIHALEQVPEILRSRALGGHIDGVEEALERVSEKQIEVERCLGALGGDHRSRGRDLRPLTQGHLE
jgi:hypothetical protein